MSLSESDRMFIDEAHIAKIAAALWSRSPIGNAAALIGAGFSLNADPALASSAPMPTWRDLVHRMARELHPGSEEQAQWRRQEAELSAGATSGALRIAQEYQAQFGREALDRLIADHVPDQRFVPGDTHHLLLELPWADLLTTNWDTLIERTAPLIEDRVYHIVHTQADIATARSPRIVKLHGTLPSHRPFIFTEEDFRTYPEDFPAFVNLARQATMENSLVLLGFSGDDPNFLYWSGWVRDNLGQHAPTIYLVGCLDLSPSRRKMLEERRVQPIDLTHLPDYASWPKAKRHALATRWFLKRLHQAMPYRRARWPAPSMAPKLTAQDIVQVDDPYAPKTVPYLPGDGWTQDQVATLLPVLQHNRGVYPGWVIAPQRARSSIADQCMRHARGVARTVANLPPEQAEDLLFEVNWQFEIALMPMFDEVAAPARALIDPLIDAGALNPSVKLRALGLALLRNAREFNNATTFGRLSAWLEAVTRDDPEGRDRLAYERILVAVDELDLETIDRLLAEWKPHSDPFWMVRKAALVAEFGTLEEADRLSREALVAIRRRTDKDRDDIASWSREGYALILRSYLLAADWDAREETEAERAIFADRQHVLAARGCDAESNVDWFDNEMAHEPPPLAKEQSVTRLFDIGHQTRTMHFAYDPPLVKRLSAFQALRFHEEIGRPARMGNMLVANDSIRKAALWLVDVDATRATNALLRSAKADAQELELMFSRSALALMDNDRADMLAQRLMRNAKAMLARLADDDGNSIADTRFRVAIEALSRMAVRVPAVAPELCELAIAVYLAKPKRNSRRDTCLKHLFERSYTALSKMEKRQFAPRLFQLPLPEYFDAANPTFDPAEIVKAYEFDGRDSAPWRPIIAALLPALLVKKDRAAAQFRLHLLSGFGLLTEAEQTQYSEALWDPAFLEDGLPGETRLYSWVFANEGIVSAGALAPIKARLLATEDFGSTDAMRTIITLLAGVQPALHLTPDECSTLVRNYLAWIRRHDASRASTERDISAQDVGDAIGRSLPIVAEMGLSNDQTASETASFLTENLPHHGTPVLPTLLRHQLITPEQALAHISPAFLGNDDILASLATRAIMKWMELEAPPLPDRIWDSVIDATYARLSETLHLCLGLLNYGYEEKPDHLPLALDQRVAGALLLILEETRHDKDRDSLAYDPGSARRVGGRLITAMRKADRLDDTAYEKWCSAALAERVREIDLPLEAPMTSDE